MTKNSLLFTLLVILFISCNTDNKPKTDMIATSASFDSILDAYYEDGLKLNPINATTSGDMRYNDEFPNFLSQTYRDSLRSYYEHYQETANAMDDSKLSETELLSKKILLWECELNLETLTFDKDKYMPIDQMWSVNLFMGQLASGAGSQPFKTVADYENWLERVDGFLTWLTTAEANMREGMEKGFVLPESLIRKVIPQMEAMTDADVESHLFYGPVLNFPSDFSAAEKEKISAEFDQMITNKVIPAYQEMHDFLEKEYLPRGRKTSGIADLPSGADYYNHQIKLYTTTDMTAGEIHQLGLDEVIRIAAEMEKEKEQVGFKGDLKAFFDDVRENKKLMPYMSAKEIIAHFNEIKNTVEPNLDKLFSVKP
ncbi:MAG: DUF885 domain-containing protein, partial [Leeuwenhoekiella sp.]